MVIVVESASDLPVASWCKPDSLFLLEYFWSAKNSEGKSIVAHPPLNPSCDPDIEAHLKGLGPASALVKGDKSGTRQMRFFFVSGIMLQLFININFQVLTINFNQLPHLSLNQSFSLNTDARG
jgi:hypothetical protein